MQKLINADDIPWFVEGVGDIPVVTKEEIDAMPEAVVHCRDCVACLFGFTCLVHDTQTKPDNYCSWGAKDESDQ